MWRKGCLRPSRNRYNSPRYWPNPTLDFDRSSPDFDQSSPVVQIWPKLGRHRGGSGRTCVRVGRPVDALRSHSAASPPRTPSACATPLAPRHPHRGCEQLRSFKPPLHRRGRTTRLHGRPSAPTLCRGSAAGPRRSHGCTATGSPTISNEAQPRTLTPFAMSTSRASCVERHGAQQAYSK